MMPYCILKKTQIDLASFLISYNKNCHFVYLSPSESMLVCLNVESETYYGPKKNHIQLKDLFLIDSSCYLQQHSDMLRVSGMLSSDDGYFFLRSGLDLDGCTSKTYNKCLHRIVSRTLHDLRKLYGQSYAGPWASIVKG